MSIIVRDETANALILTIDDSGQMYFGDGTPIDMVSLAGYGIIDSNGVITHGAGSSTAVPNSGSANCGINQSFTVTTIGGRVPNVQMDTSYPAGIWTYNPPDPDGVPPFGELVTYTVYGLVHGCEPATGSFVIQNNNSADGTLTEPSSDNYDSSLNTAPVGYRWI